MEQEIRMVLEQGETCMYLNSELFFFLFLFNAW